MKADPVAAVGLVVGVVVGFTLAAEAVARLAFRRFEPRHPQSTPPPTLRLGSLLPFEPQSATHPERLTDDMRALLLERLREQDAERMHRGRRRT